MPFSKGDPNINRKGAPPKEWTWAGLIRQAMEQKNLDGEPIKKAVSQALVDKAMEGDVQALKEVGNRLDGMPIQKNVVAGDGEEPLMIRIIEDTALKDEQD